MGQAKWYTLTPGRRHLLVALVLALLAFAALFGRQLDCAAALRDAGKKDEPENGPRR
jgi:hypothetical protein